MDPNSSNRFRFGREASSGFSGWSFIGASLTAKISGKQFRVDLPGHRVGESLGPKFLGALRNAPDPEFRAAGAIA